MFFSLNGPNRNFIEASLNRSTNPHEQAQLSGILQERDIFDRAFEEINAKLNETIYGYALTDLQAELTGELAGHEKEELAKRMMKILVDVQSKRMNSALLVDLSGEEIGLDQVNDFLMSSLKDLLGNRYETVVAKVIKEMEDQKRKALEEARAAELARLEAIRAEEQRKAAEEQAERARQEAIRAKMAKVKETYTTAANFKVTSVAEGDPGIYHTMAFSPDGKTLLAYSRAHGRLNIVKEDGSTLTVNGNLTGTPLEQLLKAGMGNVLDIQTIDNETAVIMTSMSAIVFNYKTQETIIDINLPQNEKNRITISADRKLFYVYEAGLSRISAYDVKTGAASRRPLSAQVTGKQGQSAFAASAIANNVGAHDTFHVTADGKKAYLGYASHKHLIEIDMTSGATTYEPLMGSQLTLAQVGGVNPEKALWGVMVGTNSSTISFMKSTFERPSDFTRLDIPLNGAGSVQGAALLEGGALALVATSHKGLVLVNLLDKVVVAENLMGQAGYIWHVDSAQSGAFAFWDHTGGPRLVVARPNFK